MDKGLNFVPAVLVSNKLSESSTWFSMVFQCPGIQIFPSFSIGYTASPNPSSTVSLSWSAVVVSIGYPCSPEASEMSLKDIVNCNTINMHKKTSKRILKTFQKHSKSICSNREIDSNQIHKVSVYILVIILQNSLYSYGLKTVSFCLETFPLPEKKRFTFAPSRFE